MGECAQVIAAIAAGRGPHALAGLPGKRFERLRCDARPDPFKRTLGALFVGVGLIADGLQFRNAALQHRVSKIGDAILDGVVEPLELGVDLGRMLAQFGDMRCPALGAFLPAVKHGREDFLEAARLQETSLDVVSDKCIQFFHRHRATSAAGLALAGLG